MALTIGPGKAVLDPHPIRHGKEWHVQGTYAGRYKAHILSFKTEAEAVVWLKRVAESLPKSGGADD
jgi:hypothetical protein